MTPEQKIRHAILNIAADFEGKPPPTVTAANVDELYEALAEGGDQDAREALRGGEVVTGLPCEYSRNYESKSVAARMPDGSWVGWTYWYGGGKHGWPEGMAWMNAAYDLTCVEEEKRVTVQTFSKVGPPSA